MPAQPASEQDLEAVARGYGIPEDKVHLFVSAVKSVAEAMQDGPKR